MGFKAFVVGTMELQTSKVHGPSPGRDHDWMGFFLRRLVTNLDGRIRILVLAAVAVTAAKYLLHALAAATMLLSLVRAAAAAAVCLFHVLAAAAMA
jgi:hypothetical protein